MDERESFCIVIQFYSEYTLWEDFLNGMYDIPNKIDNEKFVLLSIEMLSNKELFLKTCIEVIGNWTISTRVNLTNVNCNRKAWLGQSACSFKFKSPEISTRIAWGLLTEFQRVEANNIAMKVISSFELNYEKTDTILY